MMTLRAFLPAAAYYQHPMPRAPHSLQEHRRALLVSINQILPNSLDMCKKINGCGLLFFFNPCSLPAGLPGGVATHSSNSSDIKREDKDDDDDNSSIADKSEEEKRDSKLSRSRIRYEIML